MNKVHRNTQYRSRSRNMTQNKNISRMMSKSIPKFKEVNITITTELYLFDPEGKCEV